MNRVIEMQMDYIEEAEKEEDEDFDMDLME